MHLFDIEHLTTYGQICYNKTIDKNNKCCFGKGEENLTYSEAKGLHNEDEVIRKKDGTPLYVVQTRVHGLKRTVRVLCDDGNWYHHRELL